jgi:acetyl esterase/lipase
MPLLKPVLVCVLLLSLVFAVAACGKLRSFDALVPYDAGGRKIAADIAFGPDARQRLDIYAPKQASAEPRPVIVFIYGGSWASGSRKDYGFAAHALAAEGFVTVVPDYRLVPAVRFPDFIDDGAAAVKWVQDNIAQHGGDADRIVLMGHSAGAYITMMLALDARYLAHAGADSRKIKGVIGLAGPYDFYPYDVPATVNAFGAAPDPAQTQPINFVRADAPPILLLTGEADTTVRPRNSKALAAKLQQAGAPVTLKLYPKVSHAEILLSLSRPLRGRAPALADAMDFADKVVQKP